MITNIVRVPLRRLGVVAAIVVALGAAFAAPASAHTRLISSSPGRESTVASVSVISLVYSDKIRNAKVLVKDGKGKSYETGTAETKDKTVTQALRGRLPGGDYTIVWRVVGQDGHPIQSDKPLKFSVDPAAAPEPVPSATPTVKQDTTTADPSVQAAPTSVANNTGSDSGSGGGARWLLIGSGLLIGLGIGFAFVFLRKRKPTPGSGD